MLKYLSKVGDTHVIEQRRFIGEHSPVYLVKFWDRDWGRCIGSETDTKLYQLPPDHLWHRMGEYIMDDFGALVLKRKCFNSGRAKQDMSVWSRDFYTGVMKERFVNEPVSLLPSERDVSRGRPSEGLGGPTEVPRLR